ncbi:MAG: DNA replication/repair protein RecF [Rhodobacteraceae bacterium]|nr:DNA replication/repair protein RecF [Paracoccaceae bacterium]
MVLSGLSLSHFRSHLLTRIGFDGRPVAIFGANGAGKTNILEAISLLSPGRGLRRAAPEDLARRPEALGWKIVADLGGHEVETFAQGAGPRVVRIDGKAAPQAALGRLARILWLVPVMDRLWVEAPEGRRRFLDRMTLSFVPGHGEAALSYEKAMRERNRLLRDQAGDGAWFGALEAQMAEHGAVVAANRRVTLARLHGAMAGAQTAFPAADLALSESGPEDVAGLAAALADGRARDMAAGRSLTGPHRADLLAVYAAKGVPAAQCSTGEQKALLISLILANARALAAEGEVPTLLLDEVAAHLDAGRRAALYAEVCGLGVQAFMTGTGADLFEGLAGRAQFFEMREADGVSRVVEGKDVQ